MIIKPIKKKSNYLRDRLPIFALEEDKVIFKDGRVGIGFLVSGAPLESWTESQYSQANDVLSQQLKMLPVGTVVQKTDIYFDKEYKVDNIQKSAYYEAKLHEHFFARLTLLHESYLFLSFPSRAKGKLNTTSSHRINPVSSMFAYGGSILKNPFSSIEDLLKEAESLAASFIKGLYSLKDVSFSRLKEEELNTLYLRYINLSFDTPCTSLNRVIYNDFSALAVGEKKANVITMCGQGSEVFASVKNHYGVSSPYTYQLSQYMQFPHVVTQCLLVEDTERELKNLDFERKLNDSLEWLTTQDHELKARELEEFTAYVRSGNTGLVSLHQSVMVFESDEQLRKSYVERTVSAIRQLYGAEAVVESYDTANLFFASLPGNGFQHYRWLITSADLAACYLHFMSNWNGNNSGDYLCDRFGNLLQVNLFNTRQANQNCVVIGPSGSGKSYTMGNFIAQRLERGARQIIIDKGGTYRNVMYALNLPTGQAGGKQFDETYFEYSAEKPLVFNPFLLEKDNEGKYLLTAEKSNFLIAVLSTIWKGGSTDGSGKQDLTPAERAIFKMILPRYYQHLDENPSSYPGINSFFHFLRQYHRLHEQEEEYRSEIRYFDMEQFLTVLRPFVSGEYRQVLNAVQEISISEHNLVCFDMDKINTDPVLYPLITLLITELALDQIRKYPEEIKYLYLDEAWSMLSGSLQEFINELFRTIRKNNGSVCIITQGLGEIKKSSVGEAVLVNADTKIILKHQDKRLVSELASHLGFIDHEIELIHSMRVEKTFRELFIKQGEEARVFRLETSPHLDAVLSSKPEERNFLKKLIERYQGNLPFAVNQFVENAQSQ
ncbi:type IV secretion system protein VirB4 [Catalinimonas sp. 4WD22]|uniref:VirB4 family type IV secretion system protein n=1 Tax=Catalinimonas locisalis TaxID=3133978 RepID=UPI003100B37B